MSNCLSLCTVLCKLTRAYRYIKWAKITLWKGNNWRLFWCLTYQNGSGHFYLRLWWSWTLRQLQYGELAGISWVFPASFAHHKMALPEKTIYPKPIQSCYKSDMRSSLYNGFLWIHREPHFIQKASPYTCLTVSSCLRETSPVWRTTAFSQWDACNPSSPGISWLSDRKHEKPRG